MSAAGPVPTMPAERTVAAVLFDMDGLLVDSEPLWTVAEVTLAEHLGGTWTSEMKAAVVGTRLDVAVPTVLRMLGRPVDDAAVAQVSAWLLDRMVQLFGEDLPLRPGAAALLDAVLARGVPTALVSSSYRPLVDAALATLGAGRFAVTVAGDEVTRGKPHPEPYLRAAARLGVDPAACVVLEDSLAGVRAGEAAGCVVVAVPDVAPVPAAAGRHVVGTLVDVDVDWLLSLAGSAGAAPGRPAT